MEEDRQSSSSSSSSSFENTSIGGGGGGGSSQIRPQQTTMSLDRRDDEAAPRKVMVVADPTRESMGALEWALSHALFDKDQIILLHVMPASASWRVPFGSFSKRGPASASPTATPPPSPNLLSAGGGGGAERGGDFMEVMRAACLAKLPKVKVWIETVEIDPKEGKGATILSQTVTYSIDMLVIGQRRPSNFSPNILACKISGSNKWPDTAEYCIANSKCLCVGVQKKGQNAGYLLNTKRHRNFWHLA